MKVPPRTLDAFVKKPPANIVAVLLYGPDEGLIRERALHLIRSSGVDEKDPFGIVEFAGDELISNPSRLLDEAQSISMLGGKRVVRVRDAGDKTETIIKDALKALKAGDNLVIIEGGEMGTKSKIRSTFEGAENAAAVPCYVDDERDLGRIIGDELRNAGFRIPAEALTYMAGNVIGDRGVARGEAEKLMLYMGAQRDISMGDVIACVGAGAMLSLDELSKTMCSGLYAEADKVLRQALSEGTNAVAILRHLQNYFAKLQITKARALQGEDLEFALKKLKPPLFFKLKDAFVTQVSSWSLQQLAQAQNILMTAEAKCKQTGSEPDLLLGRAVLTLSQMGGRALNQRRRA
ncbi:MAG: DNA polymerase III subunit delta [Micavibrio sp.]|nr:DNA polymerase III subunit delta [Micavibrio sp.]